MNSSRVSSRRLFLEGAGLSAAFGMSGVTCSFALGQDAKTRTADNFAPLHRFPRMTQEWLVQQVREAERRGNALRDALRTEQDALAYVKSCQQRARLCFGPEPEKTPLLARTTRIEERDTYRIENVIFESRPGFLVTANLYVPKRAGKCPGVVGTCGHSANGKAAEAYQFFAQGLARQGYVVLIYDPIGQGERLQYSTPDAKSKFSPGVNEHIQMGNQQYLVGEFLGSWFAWDGIRALDYLLSRDEVDPNHIGLTGNSGGGTQTTWLCAVEQRWTMAAPACFVTTFRRNAENELPADTEQCPPRALRLGLDHCDFLAALAPKPIVIVAQEKDYFDARGAEEAFGRLKRLYGLLGKPDNIRLHIGGSYHGYSQENREAMYRFFNQQTKIEGDGTEPKLILEKDETLWCTPRGSVRDIGSRTVFSMTRQRSQELAKSLEGRSAEELIKKVRELLRLPKQSDAPDYRILRGVGSRKYPSKNYCSYAVETEPGIHALVSGLFEENWTSRPMRAKERAILYISHRSADHEARNEALVQTLVQNNNQADVYVCDVRGIGESQPDTCGKDTFDSVYGSDYFQSAHGLMLDRPVLGQRVWDAMQVARWLETLGYRSVHLVGNGWGALVATLAATQSPIVTKVTLKNALRSFQEIAETESYSWPLAFLVDGQLQQFDLPQCYKLLESKGLEILSSWGASDGTT